MAKTKAPDRLGRTGKKLWDDITTKYVLRSDELRTLEDACAASDMIEAFSVEWATLGYPTTAKGSMGQLVEHPLIGSIDKQRKARQAFLRQLKLPDEPTGAQVPNQQRKAAQSRWAAAHGQSA